MQWGYITPFFKRQYCQVNSRQTDFPEDVLKATLLYPAVALTIALGSNCFFLRKSKRSDLMGIDAREVYIRNGLAASGHRQIHPQL